MKLYTTCSGVRVLAFDRRAIVMGASDGAVVDDLHGFISSVIDFLSR